MSAAPGSSPGRPISPELDSDPPNQEKEGLEKIMLRLRHLPALVLALLLAVFVVAPAYAQEGRPEDALRALNAHVERALSLVQAGDLAGAKTEFEQFRTGWFQMEDGVRAASRDAYTAIEDAM